jgi:hypothetical protein
LQSQSQHQNIKTNNIDKSQSVVTMLLLSKSILALVAAVVTAISPVSAQERQKILALHGGGGTAEGMYRPM